MESVTIAGKRFKQTSMHIVGIVALICPRCGYMGKHRFQPTTWTLQCKQKGCQQKFTVGLRLLAQVNSSIAPVPPPDYVIPEAWTSGESVIIVE